jgi:hypothetical protein
MTNQERIGLLGAKPEVQATPFGLANILMHYKVQGWVYAQFVTTEYRNLMFEVQRRATQMPFSVTAAKNGTAKYITRKRTLVSHAVRFGQVGLSIVIFRLA